MEKKEYASVDVAKKLRANSCCYSSDSYYRKGDGRLMLSQFRLYYDFTSDIVDCVAPSLHDAQKWLREVHNIDVCPFPEVSQPFKDYCCAIFKDNKHILDKVAYGDNYEEALNDGIREALKMI